MDDKKVLLLYYIIKRFFICVDEWLFYLMIYKLVDKEYFKVLPLILLYGGSCIYTSYINIDRVERSISDTEQMVFLFDRSGFIGMIYKFISSIKNKININMLK